MNLFSDLNPETDAQREVATKIERLGDEMAAWMIREGRRDHRQRPDAKDTPQHAELVALIRQLCKLKEQGL